MDFDFSMVTTWNRVDGIADFSKHLVKGFEKLGKRVEIVEIKKPGNKNPIYWIKLAKKTRSKKILIQYEHGIWGTRFANLAVIPFFLVSKLRKKEIYSIIHTYFIPTGGLKGFIRKIMYYPARKVVELLSNKVIFLNEASYKLSNSKNKVYIPHGCLEEQERLNKEKCKKTYGFSKKDIVIVIPGFVSPWKGHQKAIEFLEYLPQNFKLFIAGYISHWKQKLFYKELKEFVKERGLKNRVKFLDRFVKKNEWKYIFSLADVVIFPYLLTTQSGIFNVAISYKVPIVASQQPFFVEVKRKYDCIIISSIEDFPKNIITAMKKEKVLAKKSEKYIKERNWGSMAKKFVNLMGV